MIPILYKEKETDFSSNGLGLLKDTVSCYAEEERNETYELSLTYPVGSFLYNEIKCNRYIKAKANNRYGPQIFRIYYISKPIGGKITVKAEHISYELKDNFVEKVDITGNCQSALNALNKNSAFSSGFTFKSDITTSSKFSIELTNLWECIKGSSGSIIDTYGNGADIIRNNFNISVVNNGGQDNDVLIAYKKNLTGFTCEEDWTGCITKIYPYATKDETRVTLPEKYISSQYVSRDKHPRIQAVDFTDKFGEDEEITVDKLRSYASKYFKENKCDIPSLNYSVEFVDLSKTEEFKNLGLNENVELFDNVIIRHELYCIDTKVKVLKVKYNCLLEKYDKIQLNFTKNTITSTISNTIKQVAQAAQDLKETKEKVSVQFGEIDNKFQATVQEDELGSLIEAATDHILLAVNDAKGETGLSITRENGVVITDGKLQIFTSGNKRVFWVTQNGDIHLCDDGALFVDGTVLQKRSLQMDAPDDIVVEMSTYKDGINFDCPIFINHKEVDFTFK